MNSNQIDLKSKRVGFEAAFRKTEIFKRETQIRNKCILEFSEAMNGYFNIVTNDAWVLWLAASNQTIPEGYALFPKEPTKEIHEILGFQCFTFIRPSQIYRELGFEIKQKAEHEQAFFLFKFLHLALEHGEKYLDVFNAETKKLVDAKLSEQKANEQ